MKKLRIFAFPSHVSQDRTGGVDFFRIIQPMKALNGYVKDGYKFEVEVFDPKITGAITKPEKILNYWVDVMKRNDILFLNYTTDPWGFAPMGAVARHYHRLMVLDMDDNLWNVQQDNPVYKSYQKGSDGIRDFTAIVNEVDYVTTTNQYLKHVIEHNTYKTGDKIGVMPNYVDLDNIYTHRSPFKNTDQIQLLHHGSTTHFVDLAEKQFGEGIDRIMKDYPNVTLKTVGAFLPQYKQKWGQRYVNAFGHQDYYKWAKEVAPTYMDESDIMVVPLADNVYTRCKSNIKYNESSAFGKPGVYQRIRQYEETITEGENGYLAETADEWYNAIKKLIDDTEHRRVVGENAINTTKKEWQMKDHLDVYADFFIKILTKQTNSNSI